MTKPEPVEYRMPSKAPTNPGWYYGRRKMTSFTPEIEPVEVCVWTSGFMDTVYPNRKGKPVPFSDYVWYGPIREVREGSADRIGNAA